MERRALSTRALISDGQGCGHVFMSVGSSL